MTQSLPNRSPAQPPLALLAAFSSLCMKAKGFYRQKAETAGSGNLRRQFTALATLHQQLLYLLPPPEQSDEALAITSAFAELSHWYDNRSMPTSVATIQLQLLKQLQLQKTMVRKLQPGQHQRTLLHFTASLQIAADQFGRLKPAELL